MFPTDRRLWLAAGVLIFALPSIAAPALAEPMRSRASFNTAVQTPAAELPAGGAAVVYPAALDGGALDGCRMEVTEQLFPRDEGAWGIFQVATAVVCPDGGFRYTSTGAWDATGFHGAGRVEPGSGTGAFEGLQARIAQIGSTLTPSDDKGNMDISFDLVVDPLPE